MSMINKDLTPCGRVMAVLHGDIPIKTPFTTHEESIFYKPDGRLAEGAEALCKRGMCLYRKVQSFTVHYPNVKRKVINYTGGKRMQYGKSSVYDSCR